MQTKIYLAPMSGVTDLPFRLISRKLGAGHCFFEMLDAKSVIYRRPKNQHLLQTLKKDSPISAQLVGAEPAVMLEAAEKLLSLVDISFLDINSACPARKVVRKGAGAALLKDTDRLGKIIKKLTARLKIPVTVKLRTGFHKEDVRDIVQTARICQDNGASCLFIHGRTRSQFYSGDIDYSTIRACKQALSIPVIGSGNILTPFLAKEMLVQTGCDGILVARGALGNPWIFKNIACYLKSGRPLKEPGLSLKKKVLLEHLGYIEKYKHISRNNKIGLMGKVTMWYLKGLFNAARLREQICQTRSCEKLLELIKQAVK